MKKNRYIFSSKHKSTKRNYLKRMINKKYHYMSIAKKYSFEYWDGSRESGYGGYKYIDGYWIVIVKKLIKLYKLNNKSKVLDVGCGKGFLLYELKKTLPGIEVHGLDISKYAISKAPKEIKKNLKYLKAQTKYPFKNKYFDLVISFGCIHNLEIFDLKKCLKEITRVGRKQFVLTESYRNNKELFNLQCWALTCESFFSPKEWKWIFDSFGYSGDYEFIYFE
tara:strand:- start:416 stop:1081 length:666 start_codon:yes stop_codon:yes gene_type:complete